MLVRTYLLTLTTLTVYHHHVTSELCVKVDYSGLAGEAESNKQDILTFLHQEKVKEQYENLYNSLLQELVKYQDSALNNSRRASSTRRIVSGLNTSIASVPWQASLRDKNYPICGGSVVTDIYLVTAGHCLLRVRATDLNVRLGSSWRTHGGEMYDVKRSLVHPQYNSKSKANDVGLVELYSQLRFSAKILPIRIVDKDTRLKADSAAIVSGWGKLKEGGVTAAFLQSTTIRTIVMKLCKRSGLARKAINPKSMFCAGSFTQPSPDACQGDSGGPIVYQGVLIGVVSWGLGCARGNFPGVYTRLANPTIRNWIDKNISRKSSNSTQN